MRLTFIATAARQLDQVLTEIARYHPAGARRVQERIRAVCHLLLDHPYAGQATERHNIRRFVISPYPYLLTYRIGDDAVVIRTIRHASRHPLT